ncbi:hypothetical protein IPC782_31035 [Pseudomonas aeruginosa]|uniref:contractile injection system protein, VgrG/Pvc8 family n=1 Tax=Pseudomonas aeruginosa TaxID=287 RepID=UPI000F5394EB|nr:contractile injection system protein, VgrG/Pvc8 family [Pseudomonas aeruginosa]RPV77412.1 hypothetical protein IPC782_31035 [Pseudomonas aeruginosa]
MRQRDLKFTFVVGEGKLAFDVVEFELEEALCEPFRLNLKLASDKNAIDFRQVLDQPGTFTLWQDGRPARYVHGIVSHFTHLEDVHFTYRKITWTHEVSGTSGSDDWRSPVAG